MHFLAIALNLLPCPKTKIVNQTPKWTEFDSVSMKTATSGCKRHYTPNHCLSVFIKKEENRYHAICKLNK